MADDKKDAERYRFLRSQHWNNSNLCVVTKPKQSLYLGSYCPSGDMLDEVIDDLIKESKNGR